MDICLNNPKHANDHTFTSNVRMIAELSAGGGDATIRRKVSQIFITLYSLPTYKTKRYAHSVSGR
jgi:hypothetical protein